MQLCYYNSVRLLAVGVSINDKKIVLNVGHDDWGSSIGNPNYHYYMSAQKENNTSISWDQSHLDDDIMVLNSIKQYTLIRMN